MTNGAEYFRGATSEILTYFYFYLTIELHFIPLFTKKSRKGAKPPSIFAALRLCEK